MENLEKSLLELEQSANALLFSFLSFVGGEGVCHPFCHLCVGGRVPPLLSFVGGGHVPPLLSFVVRVVCHPFCHLCVGGGRVPPLIVKAEGQRVLALILSTRWVLDQVSGLLYLLSHLTGFNTVS